MRFIKTIFQKLFLCGIIFGLASAFSSCDDDDNGGGGSNTNNAEGFFISATGESSEYILLTEEIESGEMSISDNIKELEMSGYTWIFNSNPSAAIGLIYNQGDPGIGLGYGIGVDNTLQKKGEFEIRSRFTSYGFFGNYALTSVGGQALVDENGNSYYYPDGTEREDGVVFNFISLTNYNISQKSMQTYNITGNGDQATLSGIVDMGNGEFLTGLVVSQATDESAEGGSSSGTVNYPDSVWVAALDADLNVKRIYRDNRISYSSGRYRSQYYSQIAKTENGTIYVFSGAYDANTTKKAGALKINKNAEEFDSEYYFNIETPANGYRFRKVWYITDNYFLLEFYNEPGAVTTTLAPATQYGIVDMEAKTFKWLGGEFPAKDAITDSGLPMSYNGKMYFPVKAEGEYPTVYVIDPKTAQATKGLVVKYASNIRAIGRLLN